MGHPAMVSAKRLTVIMRLKTARRDFSVVTALPPILYPVLTQPAFASHRRPLT